MRGSLFDVCMYICVCTYLDLCRSCACAGGAGEEAEPLRERGSLSDVCADTEHVILVAFLLKRSRDV